MGTPVVDVKPIRRLEQVVINRIAAGEIIHRPASALKEMIENCGSLTVINSKSLDAKATNIQMTVKEGGLKLLQIQDNGHGIQKEDLDIVCERFTTSKLHEFSDLQKISTYGFRGEALASISHVAHLSITTRTARSKCAFQVSYGDGKPKGPPKPCAGNQGTLIVVEDLFYNVSIRRKAFQSPATEYARIAEVVGRYAIHNASVGFTLKKETGTVSDIKTPINSTTQDNIKIIFGADISRDLLDVSCEKEDLKFKMSGYISGLNCSSKKSVLLLFINHRLVESPVIKKAVDSVYSEFLAKNKFPFVYLSLEIAAQNVDVNVHPTKQEVHFLHESDIISEIQKAIQIRLLNTGKSRTMFLQTLMPLASDPTSPGTSTNKDASKSGNVYAHQMVRTDNRAQKLDAFLLRPTADVAEERNSEDEDAPESRKLNKTHGSEASPMKLLEGTLKTQTSTPMINRKMTFVNVVKENEVHLTSILNLRQEVETACAPDLREIFLKYTFVGCVNKEYSLVQHLTKLYLLNTHKLSQQLFYQIMLSDFGNYSQFKLSEPASIYELVMLALDNTLIYGTIWEESMGPKEKFAGYVADFLPSKADMLLDLFAMEIDQTGNLLSFPYLLVNYTPALEGLPLYILRLATEVNWDIERECFESFCIETSRFYAFPKKSWDETEKDDQDEPGTSLNDATPTPSETAVSTSSSSWKWTVEHALFQAFRMGFLPAKDNATNGNILCIADLPDLYKVFERC